MKPVKTQLILNIQQNQDTTGNTDGQSSNIQKRIELVPKEIPQSSLYVVF
jgi:hypothetical protein